MADIGGELLNGFLAAAQRGLATLRLGDRSRGVAGCDRHPDRICLQVLVLPGVGIKVRVQQRRDSEFSVLQAIGLSKNQLGGLLLLEGCIFVILGSLIGIGIGFGLSTLMQPFLAQILPPLGGRFVLNQMLADWPDVILRIAALVGFYGVGLFILTVSAIRNLRSAEFKEK